MRKSDTHTSRDQTSPGLKTVDVSRLLRYVFVGGSTSAVLAVTVIVLVEILGLNPTLASTIGCVLAVCYNYA